MKILVLGAGGMAGHVIATHLSKNNHAVTTLSATKKLTDHTVLLDVTHTEALREYLAANTFDVVINCIGLLIQQSETRPDLAAYINGYLPHFLERTYADSATKVIHLSTDCVFSGQNAPYHENAAYDGQTFYDRSKALGELHNRKDLTFRMSIIGPDMQANGVGLFNWFMAQSGTINGFTKAMWNGITTIELAKAVEKAITGNLSGLYHLVPSENISKYDLLRLIADVFNKTDVEISPSDRLAVDKTLLNTRTDFDHTIPSYPNMIADMKEWITTNSTLYPHYRDE